MASRRESEPENGIFTVLEALPVYGPWTCTEGLIVSTLVVVPAMGDSAAVTDPLCPARPERGSGVACVLCDWLGRDAMSRAPRHSNAATSTIRQTGAAFVFR